MPRKVKRRAWVCDPCATLNAPFPFFLIRKAFASVDSTIGSLGDPADPTGGPPFTPPGPPPVTPPVGIPIRRRRMRL